MHGHLVPLTRVLVAVLRRALRTADSGTVELDVASSETGVAFSMLGGDQRPFVASAVSPVIPGIELDEQETARIVACTAARSPRGPGW